MANQKKVKAKTDDEPKVDVELEVDVDSQVEEVAVEEDEAEVPPLETASPSDFLLPADAEELVGEEHEDAEYALPPESESEVDDDWDGYDPAAAMGVPLERKAPRGLDQPLPAGRFADRELSWLAFNQRVLEQSEDTSVPLLERLWFSAIFSSNLDEFFMVRVAGLKRRIAAGIAKPGASGLAPREVLENVSRRTREMVERQAKNFEEDFLPALNEEGIHIRHWDDLDQSHQDRLSAYFRHMVFPVLTPLAVDPAHPFPYISGLSLNIAVVLTNPVTGKRHFAKVRVPDQLPRLINVETAMREGRPEQHVSRGEASFITLEDLIIAHLDHLFPGVEVHEAHTFRVTRNEDLEVEEDDAENLLTAMEEELHRRRFGPVVRLEVENSMSSFVLGFLMDKLEIGSEDVFELPAPLDFTLFNELHALDLPALKYLPFVPVTAAGLSEVESSKPADIFQSLSNHDVLLHHPYDSFATSVQHFISQAAKDPNVLAIKQTLYRTSGDSPIVSSLIEAARNDKQVVAIVEVKARFDEEANIEWARKLEEAGVHVVYGMLGLKTHAKLSLVVRQEGEVLKRYGHVGTGNYHPGTARGYEDLGLLTSDPDVTQDMTRLFNQLSGYAPKTTFRRLVVAPLSVRSSLIERIEEQAERALAGKEAWVGIKVNSIVDEKVIDALYRASQAGVPVDVVVRGICGIKAGIKGLSNNIRVRSILGRYLEHSRIFAFGPVGEEEVWIGSADLMHRNLDRRVEALVKLEDRKQIDYLTNLLRKEASSGTASWRLRKNGRWRRHDEDKYGVPLRDIQVELMDEASSRVVGR